MVNNTLFLIIGVMLMAGDVSWQKMVLLLLALAFLFLLSLYLYQEKLLYQPKIFPQFAVPSQNPPGYRSPTDHDMPFDDIHLTASDGVRLHAWFARQPDALAAPTLLFFHANAGNMGFRLLNMKELYTKLGVNIFILSYRGYGESEGEPTEEGLMLDSECAWAWLQSRAGIDVDPAKLFVFGRSLGGAVAIALTARHDTAVRGLVVENTFTSVSDMVDHLFAYLRYVKRWVLRLRWASVDTIANVTAPVLFISGLQDEVVPAALMAKLHESARRSRFKVLKTFDGTHNDTWTKGGDEYTAEMKRFMTRCLVDTELSQQIAPIAAAARAAVANGTAKAPPATVIPNPAPASASASASASPSDGKLATEDDSGAAKRKPAKSD